MDITKYLTPNGQKYIRGNEGCILHPYDDGYGNVTIGWGMTHYPNGIPVKLTDPAITQVQADAYFLQEVQPYLQCVIDYVKVPLNTNQYAALTDFCYNEGDGRFEESILLEHINNHCVVESDFTQYCYVGGIFNQGLLNRRQSEYNLYITNVLNAQQAQTTTSVVPNTMDNPVIKWTKFYDSATKTVVTYFNTEKILQNPMDNQSYDFVDAADAIAKSACDEFIFWNNVAMGHGTLAAQ